MAALDVAEPEAKRPCTPTVTLHPLKDVGDLRERYTEGTADVFFVKKETKERLPAHRQVLSVASPIFFKMFDGDWKEKRMKEIPAPEEYNWESFKAAITLLYGEEVEVEESSIPDIYRVAHLYDLRGVIAILVREVCQWDSRLLDTVVELCVLTQEMPERIKGIWKAAVQHIAPYLKQLSSSDVAHLSHGTMQMLVQSDDISIPELNLLRILNQWTNAHQDITLNQMKQLYSRIRFGTIPYESLAECSVIGHDNLKSALENHQLFSLGRVSSNLVQITPRSGQKEVFQVYPMVQGLRPVVKPNGVIEVANVSESPAVGIIYYGNQEITFEVDLEMKETTCFNQGQCELRSLRGHFPNNQSKNLQATITEKCPHEHVEQKSSRWNTRSDDKVTITLNFLRWTVVLNQSGAHITLKSDLPRADGDPCATMNMDLKGHGSFPWLFAFGVRCQRYQSTARIHLLTIHPPTL